MLIGQRIQHGVFKLSHVAGNIVREIAMFCVTPHRFDGIEIRSVGRQPFDLQPGMFFPELPDCRAMYNNQRSHMERDWLPPVRVEPEEVDTLKLDHIEVKSYVGGLVKSFERNAA